MLRKYWLIISRVILFKLHPDGCARFWEWLYKRVVDAESTDYAEPIFVMFLLGDALDSGEFVRASDVYEKFTEIVVQHSNAELVEEIKYSRIAARNREKKLVSEED